MTTPENANPEAWFRTYAPRPEARTRLICCPHAGGGASSFRAWATRVPASVELVAVQYPGHEDRLGEHRLVEMPALLDGLGEALPHVLDRPYVLLGHSMGAAIAHETALRLEQRGWPLPRWLVVSGRQAPPYQRNRGHHLLDDDGFAEQLRTLGGASDEALDHPDIRRLLLPVVRDDYRLIERYEPSGGHLERTNVLACVGDADPNVTVAEVEKWRDETSADFEVRVFPGGHFFLQEREDVLDEVLRVTIPEVAAT